MIDRSDPLWYKDAIIYQLHVKAFQDDNGDGVGDFAGLMQRLDYVQDLGVNAIWLLPFYPSPLRDDGYDISDYRAINPAYGTMRDFRRFVAEAHRRDIRVITELVVNHTSDQHPWFQRARRSRPGSRARDFYVWSDTDQHYQGTRIIFIDTEASNWTWDPVAQAYFWHRFYSHQPDLNYDNPRVLTEVVKALHHWLDMGVDGLRLDAVPYLVEREGTNNENLPETHEVLRRIRAQVDKRYPDRMLLAEANQWPEDTRPYFGEGDECHMAFHFPLMPRIYMAVAQEDRHPITDIIAQTPDIPDNCQWAIFLRNHDELTLEMVTDTERDYLWQTYAFDKRMRLNLGIRRRLAPLLDNDRRKIELLNALLLSMPGTPVIYYGDEIGMGDNYYLGDRDGVRTPMQWSPDRNGGFSRADPQQLYLPPIMDAIYGYEAVNVESQQKDSSSVLSWMRRMIAVRKSATAFGRGTMSFLYPRNRKILAYLRQHGDEDILCVFNLSRAAQAVELDLAAFKGSVPVEMTGRSPFPPVGELPYMLTLPGYGFYWFALAKEAEAPAWHIQTPDPLPEFMTIVFTHGWRNITEGQAAKSLQREALPAYLMNQRWFAAKDRGVQSVALRAWEEMKGEPGRSFMLAGVDVALSDGQVHAYFLPLSLIWGEDNLKPGAAQLSYTLARVRRGASLGALTDAAVEPDFAVALVRALQAAGPGRTELGAVRFEGTDRLAAIELPADELPVRRPTIEQSNVSIIVGSDIVLKVYRRLQPGVQPEIEVSRFLTERGFANTPPFLGVMEHVNEAGVGTVAAAAFGFVVNQGSGWNVLVDWLDRNLEQRALAPPDAAQAEDTLEATMVLVRTMGRRTAEMHCAFATGEDDPAFRTEPIEARDLRRWARGCRQEARRAFAALKRARGAITGAPREAVEALLGRHAAVEAILARAEQAAPAGRKLRHHGDYHLGQVLVAHNDIHIIDFEGEPMRPLAERRQKADPVRDVAGMLRSFDYAAWSALERFRERATGDPGAAENFALAWRDEAQRQFLDAYGGGLASCGHWHAGLDETLARLDFLLLEKALYEIAYEASNRPAWLPIPVRGLLALLDRDQGGGA